jgi:hypothetical protein
MILSVKYHVLTIDVNGVFRNHNLYRLYNANTTT